MERLREIHVPQASSYLGDDLEGLTPPSKTSAETLDIYHLCQNKTEARIDEPEGDEALLWRQYGVEDPT